jgi:hypothetical protein
VGVSGTLPLGLQGVALGGGAAPGKQMLELTIALLHLHLQHQEGFSTAPALMYNAGYGLSKPYILNPKHVYIYTAGAAKTT